MTRPGGICHPEIDDGHGDQHSKVPQGTHFYASVCPKEHTGIEVDVNAITKEFGNSKEHEWETSMPNTHRGNTRATMREEDKLGHL